MLFYFKKSILNNKINKQTIKQEIKDDVEPNTSLKSVIWAIRLEISYIKKIVKLNS